MDIFIDLKVEKENIDVIKEMLPYTSEHIKNIYNFRIWYDGDRLLDIKYR